MKKRLKLLQALAVAGTLAFAAGSAHAVATYGNIADPPGVYFGTGNVNGNWTIDTENGIEVGLRAKNRATLATIDGSSGIYHAAPGLCNPTCTGGSKAMWNYEFSVNVGSLNLADLIVTLSVDTDPGAGVNFTALDVKTNWKDNAYRDGAVTRKPELQAGADTNGPTATEEGVQQSANPLFGDSGFGFLPGQGLYDIMLQVFDQSGTLLASSDIKVQVPEPASILLLGIGLAGLGFSGRRRKTT